MKIKVPTFIRYGNYIEERGPQGLLLREYKFKSISQAKRQSREFQAGQMGSGILRMIESLRRHEDT